MIQIAPQFRILVAIEAIDGRKGIDALAQLCREKLDADPFSGCVFIFRTFQWWPTGTEPAQTLRAHQAQLLLAAGNPDAEAPPPWRPLQA